jgi:hypothetical protein
LHHRLPQLRAPRQLALHDRPVLTPRHREDVAHEEVQAEPGKLPRAIGRDWGVLCTLPTGWRSIPERRQLGAPQPPPDELSQVRVESIFTSSRSRTSVSGIRDLLRWRRSVQHTACAIDVGVGRRTIHRDVPGTAEQ